MHARISLLALLLTAGQMVTAAGQEQVKLFKVITPKDEVVLG